MSNEDLDASTDITADPLVPTDKTGKPLKWDDNPATISGLLHEIAAYCRRKQVIQAYITNGVAPLPGGKIAVPDINTAQFIRDIAGTARVDNVHTFVNPCPPTPARRAAFTARTGIGTINMIKIPDENKDGIVVSDFAVISLQNKKPKQNKNNTSGTGMPTNPSTRGLARAGHQGHTTDVPAETSLDGPTDARPRTRPSTPDHGAGGG